MKLNIKGKPENVSLEEARAWLWASYAVLGFHNLHPIASTITVRFRKRLRYMGQAYRNLALMDVRSTLGDQETFTTILHEMIHLCKAFSTGTEACTSSLCSRLKPDVARLAKVLLNGTYRRAAAVAHTRISYAPRDGSDHYNPLEDSPVSWTPKYRAKRRRQRKGGPT